MWNATKKTSLRMAPEQTHPRTRADQSDWVTVSGADLLKMVQRSVQREKEGRREKGRKKAAVTPCKKCRQTGHFADKCTWRETSPKKVVQEADRRRQKGQPKESWCLLCGNYGHAHNSCPWDEELSQDEVDSWCESCGDPRHRLLECPWTEDRTDYEATVKQMTESRQQLWNRVAAEPVCALCEARGHALPDCPWNEDRMIADGRAQRWEEETREMERKTLLEGSSQVPISSEPEPTGEDSPVKEVDQEPVLEKLAVALPCWKCRRPGHAASECPWEDAADLLCPKRVTPVRQNPFPHKAEVDDWEVKRPRCEEKREDPVTETSGISPRWNRPRPGRAEQVCPGYLEMPAEEEYAEEVKMPAEAKEYAEEAEVPAEETKYAEEENDTPVQILEEDSDYGELSADESLQEQMEDDSGIGSADESDWQDRVESCSQLNALREEEEIVLEQEYLPEVPKWTDVRGEDRDAVGGPVPEEDMGPLEMPHEEMRQMVVVAREETDAPEDSTVGWWSVPPPEDRDDATDYLKGQEWVTVIPVEEESPWWPTSSDREEMPLPQRICRWRSGGKKRNPELEGEGGGVTARPGWALGHNLAGGTSEFPDPRTMDVVETFVGTTKEKGGEMWECVLFYRTHSSCSSQGACVPCGTMSLTALGQLVCPQRLSVCGGGGCPVQGLPFSLHRTRGCRGI
ncbi:uncharacterized protein LOC134966261 [Pseudophryne corroboree]|uniref:uncharacterized protein LOC134966261 n=1 Tax=Pseudophryne corroboree TaxID=495146 RepID=UPI0030813232